MTNSTVSKNIPFIKNKFVYICIVFITLISMVSVHEFFEHSWDLFVIFAPLLSILFTFYVVKDHQKYIHALESIEHILKYAKEGKTHVRTTDTKGLGEIGYVAWELNDFLDIVETNFKEMSNSFSCRLGKWYYEGDGLNNYNSLPAYQNLEIHHKDVHSHIHQALHLVQNDWMNQDDIFDQLIQTVSNAEHASGQVIENISRLVEQKHPNH